MATSEQVSGSRVPYVAQDVREVAEMLRSLEETKKDKRKGGFIVKKTTYDVKKSTDRIRVDSWKMPMESDYKKRDLPTYARGLFTTKNRRNEPEIVVRGYDKFFNTGEVNETKWENILTRTQGPYELTLKENGCIIFLSGLEDGTLLVCSKHSTGERDDAELSHAIAGERLVERQLAALGRTTQDLAAELRNRNATAVAELCDDSFEEHVLAYGPDKAGLYLHGINLNLPKFATYPSADVQSFANAWGFKKVDLMIMHDINEVKTFLEGVAESGAHDGRDVEGFVIRCRESYNPAVQPYRDWFFKYKFEEPYLMYRQWRECTKALISGKTPKFKKHVQITEEYLLYARKRLREDPGLGARYQANHGIISLRDDFLAFKNIKGSDAANLELDADASVVDDTITRDVILVPIATIGCGKTTIAVALTKLFLWGHVQNDNIQGKGRPPRFTKQVLDLLQDHPVVIADRNNAQKHERKQILTDVKLQHKDAKLVALYFDHSEANIDDVRKVTQGRVIARGDNHQTIHAASNQEKFLGIMEGFIDRFEPLRTFSPPDDGFDNVIKLDPTADSRQNLETTLTELHRLYPGLVKEVPSAEKMDAAIQETIGDYQPTLKHTIPDRGPRKQKINHQQAAKGPKKKKPLEYMSVDVAAHEIRSLLDKTFDAAGMPLAKFYKQLSQTRRIQPKFHVTLMHRASSKEHPELWDRYCKVHAEAEAANEGLVSVPTLGACGVELERVVFDERVMAIVVRISDQDGQGWECINPIAHITIGTANDAIKPRESNDLLQRWNTEGTEGNGIHDIVFENKVFIEGTVSGVLSR